MTKLNVDDPGTHLESEPPVSRPVGKNIRRAHHRMPRKVELAGPVEDPHPCRVRRFLRRQDERGLTQIQLARQRLQHRLGDRTGVGEDRQSIPPEPLLGEDIDGYERRGWHVADPIEYRTQPDAPPLPKSPSSAPTALRLIVAYRRQICRIEDVLGPLAEIGVAPVAPIWLLGSAAHDDEFPSHHQSLVGTADLRRKESLMSSLMVDFIISLDGYAAAEGWPGFWGMEGPEYLAWLEEGAENEHTTLMGATTYRLMSGFAAELPDEPGLAPLTAMPKVAFSSTLQAPLAWANTQLVDGDAVEAVRAMKSRDSRPLRTIGSLSLCRSLLEAGVVDRFRVVVFPVITGATGRERIFDGYPDIALDLVDSRTFDGWLQLLEYVPTVLDGPPGVGG